MATSVAHNLDPDDKSLREPMYPSRSERVNFCDRLSPFAPRKSERSSKGTCCFGAAERAHCYSANTIGPALARTLAALFSLRRQLLLRLDLHLPRCKLPADGEAAG